MYPYKLRSAQVILYRIIIDVVIAVLCAVLLYVLVVNPCKAEDLPIPTNDRSWDATDKTLFAGFVALNIVDALQTVDMIKNRPDLYESNTMLGKHPSEGDVWLFKGVIVGGTYWLLKQADNISPDTRKIILGVADLIVFSAVEHNHSLGLKARISF